MNYTKKKPYITTNLDVSTTHITKKDMWILDDWAYPLQFTVYDHDYGYYIYIPEIINSKELAAIGMSKNFIHLLKLAKKNKCSFLNIDRDGVTYTDLSEEQ